MRVRWMIAILLVLALLVAGCGQAKPSSSASESSGGGKLPPAPPIEKVKPLIQKGGCGTCHTIPGIEGATGTVGPNLCDVAQEVREGKEDVNFLRESIVNPNAEIAEGYQPNIMPQNFGQLFSKEELDTLVAFIANLKCK